MFASNHGGIWTSGELYSYCRGKVFASNHGGIWTKSDPGGTGNFTWFASNHGGIWTCCWSWKTLVALLVCIEPRWNLNKISTSIKSFGVGSLHRTTVEFERRPCSWRDAANWCLHRTTVEFEQISRVLLTLSVPSLHRTTVEFEPSTSADHTARFCAFASNHGGIWTQADSQYATSSD